MTLFKSDGFRCFGSIQNHFQNQKSCSGFSQVTAKMLRDLHHQGMHLSVLRTALADSPARGETGQIRSKFTRLDCYRARRTQFNKLWCSIITLGRMLVQNVSNYVYRYGQAQELPCDCQKGAMFWARCLPGILAPITCIRNLDAMYFAILAASSHKITNSNCVVPAYPQWSDVR